MKLKGPRILLRQWKDSDYEPFASLNGDPETMRFFPSTQTREQSYASAELIRLHIQNRQTTTCCCCASAHAQSA